MSNIVHIIATIIIMYQDAGYIFNINGKDTRVYGSLVAVLADNLASNAIGGFKEGFTAYRSCRQCLATRTEAKTKVSVSLIE